MKKYLRAIRKWFNNLHNVVTREILSAELRTINVLFVSWSWCLSARYRCNKLAVMQNQMFSPHLYVFHNYTIYQSGADCTATHVYVSNVCAVMKHFIILILCARYRLVKSSPENDIEISDREWVENCGKSRTIEQTWVHEFFRSHRGVVVTESRYLRQKRHCLVFVPISLSVLKDIKP